MGTGGLLKIASVLHGSADGLPDVADLEDDFRTMMREAMRKVVPDVALRIRLAAGVTVAGFRQIHPADADLTEHGEAAAHRRSRFWARVVDEERPASVRLAARADGFGQNKDERLARVDVCARGAGSDDPVVLAGPEFVLAHWTPDRPEPTGLLDGYGQRETGSAVASRLRAWLAGQFGEAEKEWGRAVKLASAVDDEERLSLLAPLVDVLDPGNRQGTAARDPPCRRAAGPGPFQDHDLRGDGTAALAGRRPRQPRQAPLPPPKPAGRAAQPRPCPTCDRVSPRRPVLREMRRAADRGRFRFLEG